jgi:hypothetical protein
MDYEVVSKIHINKNKCKKIGEFLYDPEIDGLYFEGKYPFPVQLMISAGLSKCQVTPMFLKLPFILRGWINLDMLLREIDLLKFALQDKLLLHASCVDDTLIVGFPQAGKTYKTYTSVAKGGKLISEEYTVIKKDILHSYKYRAYPYKRVIRSCFSKKTLIDCNMTLSLPEKISLFLRTIRAKFMPFMFEAVIWKDIIVSGYGATIKKIVYGSTGVEVKNYKHLIILTENEFPFMANAFLEAYAVISGLDLIDIQNKQRKLIKEFVEGTYE